MGTAVLKRKLAQLGENYASLCCSLIFAGTQDSTQNRKNRILEFNVGDTWRNVLEELVDLDPTTTPLGKADTVEICLTAKNSPVDTFHPHMDDLYFFSNKIKYFSYLPTQVLQGWVGQCQTKNILRIALCYDPRFVYIIFLFSDFIYLYSTGRNLQVT